jgi:interferon gamma-inducible protein 30
MFKNILFTTATVAACGTGLEDADMEAKVVVDLYYESQCPGCKATITGSFADAVKADGFFNMATINLWPYGNAHETQTSSGSWDFTCQHGEAECQWNLVESCSKNLISCPYKSFEFINCIETSDSGTDYETLAKSCATSGDVDNIDDILSCYNGADAILLEHAIAQQTEGLSPSHTYVPWVTVGGKYDSAVQDLVQDNLLKYVCDNYSGSLKSKDCPNDDDELFLSAVEEEKSAEIELCYRDEILE